LSSWGSTKNGSEYDWKFVKLIGLVTPIFNDLKLMT
jgi:hypothetical protein